jgi:acyl-CoA oxidase
MANTNRDLNEQTAIDMANARKATSVSVETLRDFLYSGHSNIQISTESPVQFITDGRDEWEKRQKVVRTLEKDPVFDKSRRFLSFAIQ